MVPGPTLPYCLSPPKERPLFMLPNSHTHFPDTFASVKNGKKCPGPLGGSTQPLPVTRLHAVLNSVALVSVMNWICGYLCPPLVGSRCRNGRVREFGVNVARLPLCGLGGPVGTPLACT